MNDNSQLVYRRLAVRGLSAERRFAFEEIGPTCLWIAGNLSGAQPRFWGDNRGGWPVLMGLSQSWEDRKSATLQASEPYQRRAVIARLWCETWDDADRLWCESYKSLRAHFEDGKGEWMDFGTETGLGALTAAVRGHAHRLNIETYTDDEMLARLDDLVAMARRVAADEE